MEGLKNLGNINISAKKLVENFSKAVIELYGDNLLSITVYGSVLGGNFNPKKSDVNILLILKNADVPQLKRCIPAIKRYGQKINPLLITKKYIESSQDVYPIEFLEMKENHITIYREDFLDNIKIDRQHLRLECEQQLKGGLLKLKQGFLRSGLDKKRIEGLLLESINTIFTVFRNLIRIKGEEPSVDKENIIDKMAEYYEVNMDIFSIILRYKMGYKKIRGNELENYFSEYIKELENLTEKVDRL